MPNRLHCLPRNAPTPLCQKVKEELSRMESFGIITADTSAYGLGAVLLQQYGDTWKLVAYTSKAMTETEHLYSQIGKEALSLVWTCEKFSDYAIGKKIQLETDHKPLVPSFGKTNLDCPTPKNFEMSPAPDVI